MGDLIIQPARFYDGTGNLGFAGTLDVTVCVARGGGDGQAPGSQQVREHWGQGRGCPEGCQEPGAQIQDTAAMIAARGRYYLVVTHRYRCGRTDHEVRTHV